MLYVTAHLSSIQHPEEIIAELKMDVKGKLTFDKIEHFTRELSALNDAWKIESLVSLLEMLSISREIAGDENVDIETIVLQISESRSPEKR